MPLTTNHTSRYFIVIVSSSNGSIYFLRSRDMQQVAIRILTTIIWLALPKSFIYLGVYSYWAILSTYFILLLLDDPPLIHPNRMTSRLFLNLRSAGSGAPNHLQAPSVITPRLGNRQAIPPESVQITSRPTLASANLDTTLFSMASGVEQSTCSDQWQMFSWDAVETNASGDGSAGDVELQLRDR